MRSRLAFTVSGENQEDIKRKALLVVSEYLQSDDLDVVNRDTEFEFEVEANVDNVLDQSISFPTVQSFTAKVWARVK
jgi:hypothetical protein